MPRRSSIAVRSSMRRAMCWDCGAGLPSPTRPRRKRSSMPPRHCRRIGRPRHCRRRPRGARLARRWRRAPAVARRPRSALENCRLLPIAVPLLTGAQAFSAMPRPTELWTAGFLAALAEEAEAGIALLRRLERQWLAARAAIRGQRRDSHAAVAIDILAAAPIVSATSLAHSLDIAIKNAAALLNVFVARGIAIEVTHRSKRRLFGLKHLAPLREQQYDRAVRCGIAGAGRWSRYVGSRMPPGGYGTARGRAAAVHTARAQGIRIQRS